MSRYFRVLCLLIFCAFAAISVNADTATYTFEGPQFTPGETTPILNRSPNSGPAGFQASFTSSVDGAYLIFNFQPNSLFSGQTLGSPNIPSILTISFNMPVNEVQFVWAQEFTGQINFISSAGNQSQNSANVGGQYTGGTFVFSSVNSFTSFTLSAVGVTGAPENLAIDNLTLTTPTTVTVANVPEPTTLVLLGTGLLGLAKLRKRKR